jgi:long-chain fatty acid transport protein
LYAEEFTLDIVELNPVVSYKISENFAVGGGIRLIYTSGKVYSNGRDVAVPLKREMEGDTVEFGYNLALSYRPVDDITLAVTYRSNVDLDVDGDANLYFGGVGQRYGADVSVPLPAVLSLAVSKTWNDTFTVELEYERTYWSEYKRLDFNYNRPVVNPYLKAAFDDSIDKSWSDTDTFRLGMTWNVNETWTLMAGFGIDETPVPDKTVGFELPDSDAKIYSFGARYRYSDKLTLGLAFLYDDKESRTLAPGVAENDILKNGGTFSKGGAYLTTIGVSYEF